MLQPVKDFFTDFFTWREFLTQAAWAALLTIAIRAIAWLARKSLANRELAFWLIVPLSILILLSALSYVSRGRQLGSNLQGEIDSLMSGTNPENRNARSILLIVGIRNLGMPTTVEKWSLSALLGEGETRQATIIFVPENITLTVGSGEAWVWSGADALYNKTAEKPIPTGATVRGILLFVLPGVRQENLMRPGNLLTLTYFDVQGKSYSISKTITAAEGTMMYYPGLQPPRRISQER